MSDSLKHRAISRQLAEEINSGKLRFGVRLPSEAHYSCIVKPARLQN